MVFILVRPGMPMQVKNYEGADPAAFAETVREMVGGDVAVGRPFKAAPDICIAVRTGHSKLGLPANRALLHPDGRVSRILFGNIVIFAYSKEQGIRDLSLAERKLLVNAFMDNRQPDLFPLLDSIPTPGADVSTAMTVYTLLKKLQKKSIWDRERPIERSA